MTLQDIATWTVSADHIVRPKNPYNPHAPLFEIALFNDFHSESKEHTYSVDETLAPGDYPAEMFGEVIWQYFDLEWRKLPRLLHQNINRDKGTVSGANGISEFLTRQYLPLSAPISNENKEGEGELRNALEDYPELSERLLHAASFWKVDNTWSATLAEINKICEKLSVYKQEAGAQLILNKRLKHASKGYDAAHDKDHTPMQFINAAKAYMYRDSYSWPFDKPSFKLDDDIENLTNAGAMLASAIDLIKSNLPSPPKSI